MEYSDWNREYIRAEQKRPSGMTVWNAAQRHGRQPADVQQLKSEIALLCAELEEALCYRGRSVNDIIVSLRQLSVG
jgi:hypothetical protein